MFSNTYGWETLTKRFPYQESISEIYTKSGFVSEQCWAPVIKHPSDVSAHPLEICLDVVSHQRNADFWSSGPHACSMKTVSDCLCKNPYAIGILQVILQGSSHNKALILSLDDNKMVLTLSCDPITMATMPIPDISTRTLAKCHWECPASSILVPLFITSVLYLSLRCHLIHK